MLNTFNPVRLSTAENEFLLAHLGEPSIVALRSIHGVRNPQASPKDKNPIIYPDGVNPSAVKPILDGVQELLALEKDGSVPFVGLDAIKSAIRVWLRENKKWKTDHERTNGRAPRYPSLYSFSIKGKPVKGGVGSDSGEIKTYFGPAGERIPFEIPLQPDTYEDWQAPGHQADGPEDARLKIDEQASRIECRVPLPGGGICGHTESYKAGSRASHNAARARMSKHLRKATEEVEAHREVHTNEYGASTAA